MNITEANIIRAAQLAAYSSPEETMEMLQKEGASEETAYLLTVAANQYLASQPKEDTK